MLPRQLPTETMKAVSIYKSPVFTSRPSFPVSPSKTPTFNSSLTRPLPPQFCRLRLRAHCSCRAKRRDSSAAEPVLKQKNAEEAAEDIVEDDEIFEEDVIDDDDLEIEALLDDDIIDDGYDDFEDEFELEEEDPFAGDGGAGGGVALSGTSWEKEALTIAEEVCVSLGDLQLYAFKTSAIPSVQVRIEKLSNKSGSPSMSDIEEFSAAYRSRLDEAATAGTIPEDLSLEVSSPGVERAVRIPEDLERFKDRAMFVKYVTENASSPGSSQEGEGIFRLVSYNMESGYCIWGIADVRVNREKSGKGRPLNKKQKEWRLQTPFGSLRFVRIYSEC